MPAIAIRSRTRMRPHSDAPAGALAEAEVVEPGPSAEPGARAGLQQLVELLYRELRQIAHHRLQGKHATLNTTGLVHESVERILGVDALCIAGHGEFLAYAASAMRAVLVDHARRRLSQRRGLGAAHLPMEDGFHAVLEQRELLRVHEALARLEPDGRMRQVVELRYFGGLTEEEISAALGISARTVQRVWQKARRALYVAMQEA